MTYLDEHLLVGEIGRASVTLSLVAALLSAVAYYFFGRTKEASWRLLGRTSFLLHVVGVIGIVASLFAIIFNHYFEYDYAWKHSSRDLPLKYIFSSFWEGQEGSFLLWMFWQAILGAILIPLAKNWEAPVLGIFALVQVFLASMILGVYIGDLKIGSSPFILIRELPENLGLPWVNNPAYLRLIPAFEDGRGLNPLLQNYWMTIHPPTLFLGFAATLVPFAYAVGGLLRNDHKGWLKPALPWTFFAVGILGLGILMGGAWAYEALSFGGFWAWDPVENAVLVPWLTLVGGAHLLLVEKNRGGAIRSLYALILGTFLLILYSTFLTRSGVLGDSSVHSFVDLGLSGQLLIYLLTFVVISLGLFFMRFRSMASPRTEDPIWSREFWMFIGSLVLLLASFQIIFTTSIPVFNKLFGPEGWIALFKENMAPPLDAVEHYNAFQVPFAIIISILMAAGQVMRYHGEPLGRLVRKLLPSLLASLVIAVPAGLLLGMEHPVHFTLLVTSLWTVLANADYWFRMIKGAWGAAGSSIAHIGFGLILLGALISNGLQKTISANDTYIAKDFPMNENLLLELGDTVRMGEYSLVWTGERQEGPYRKYTVEYLEQNAAGQWAGSFSLEPTILMNERMGNNAEPATLHRWNKDLYTHLTYANLEEKNVDPDGFSGLAEARMGTGDTAVFGQSFVILDSLGVDSGVNDRNELNSLALKAYLSIIRVDGKRFSAEPEYRITGNVVSQEPVIVDSTLMKFQLAEILTQENLLLIKAWQKQPEERPFIVMKATVFPMINLLWAGSILMVLGTVLAILRRVRN